MGQKTIGIIGVGMVGGAMYAYYPDAIPYDVMRYPDNKEKVSEADIFFICVPTPYVEGVGCDTSIVENVLSWVPAGKTIVIRSTVIPGTTDRLQEKFPGHFKVVSHQEILSILKKNQSIDTSTEELIERAIYRGGKDNITVLMMKVHDISR